MSIATDNFREAMELLERARVTYSQGKLAQDIAAFQARVEAQYETRNAAEMVGQRAGEFARSKHFGNRVTRR